MNKYKIILYAQNLKKINNDPLNNDPLKLASIWGYEIVFSGLSKNEINSSKCIIDPLGNPISDINNIRINISEVNDELLKLLINNPDYLYQLSSRRFEELIAEILIRKGYNVELTSVTRDGGKDIYAARQDDLGSFLYLVECKKYAPNHHVGIDVIQRLYGVVSDEKATAGIIVTTSYFTKSAKDFQKKKFITNDNKRF